jgi:hypothetical protein
MIFVGNRRSEQRHNPITHDLIHRPLVAVHRRHHALQHRVEELARLLGVAVGQQLHGTFQVGEQHRDLLALAFEGGLGGEDFLGEMRGRVDERPVRAGSHWWGGRGSDLCRQRCPAFATELGQWLIFKPALVTRHPEGSAAFVTEL